MRGLSVLKYILFLFCILFFSHAVAIDMRLKSKTPPLNFGTGTDNTIYVKPNPTFSNTGVDQFAPSSDPFKLKVPDTYTYGAVSGGVRFGMLYCSERTPEACKLISSCQGAGGYWDHLENTCKRAICPFGTTAEIFKPTKCRCNNDFYAFVERGNLLQSCPSNCSLSDNKIFNFQSRSCVCLDGFTMSSDGRCNANPAARNENSAPECWRELAEKAAACETSSNIAVSQCDSGEDDSIGAIQSLLVGSAGSAKENCEQAATATTSGYHHADDTRQACDEKITSCKTGCEEAKTYLNANKERAYSACRERAFQDQSNAGPPLPAERFNAMWDGQYQASLESQFQSLLAKVDTSRTSCESGSAAKGREKLTAAMAEMNTTSKSANQCVCQLDSKTADCAKFVKGPADCLEDPTLPGCKAASVNCFDPRDTSLKCICFRNPDGEECLGPMPANMKMKMNLQDQNALAATKEALDTRGNGSELSGMAAGKGTETSGEKKSVENPNVVAESGVIAPPEGAESGISSLANGEKPKAETAAAASRGLVGGGNPRSANSSAAAVINQPEVAKKIGGLFESAKSALSGIFKKGSKSDESSEYRDRNSGQNTFDPKKFRPRGMVRGIASDSELAGKHEDIWKVMNKQYKVQDQKDNFIFDIDKK